MKYFFLISLILVGHTYSSNENLYISFTQVNESENHSDIFQVSMDKSVTNSTCNFEIINKKSEDSKAYLFSFNREPKYFELMIFDIIDRMPNFKLFYDAKKQIKDLSLKIINPNNQVEVQNFIMFSAEKSFDDFIEIKYQLYSLDRSFAKKLKLNGEAISLNSTYDRSVQYKINCN